MIKKQAQAFVLTEQFYQDWPEVMAAYATQAGAEQGKQQRLAARQVEWDAMLAQVTPEEGRHFVKQTPEYTYEILSVPYTQ